MTNKDEALKALRFISDNTVSYPNPYKQADGLEEAFHIIERALTEAPKVDVDIKAMKADLYRAGYLTPDAEELFDHLTTHYYLVKKEE